MAEPSPQQQQSFLERLMATIPDAAYRAVSPGTNLVELLRRFYSTPGTPAPPPGITLYIPFSNCSAGWLN